MNSNSNHSVLPFTMNPLRPPGGIRRSYTLAEKIAIVRESFQPGISQASLSRRYGLGKNVLWTWRRTFGSYALEVQDERKHAICPDIDILRERVAELERLLGQKSFEIEFLRNRIEGSSRGSFRAPPPGTNTEMEAR